MNGQPTPILYLNPHGERAGAERVLDALIRGHLAGNPVRFFPRVLCGSEGNFSKELREAGIDLDVRSLRLRTIGRSVSWLRGFLREHRVRLIHTTMSYYHSFAWLASRGMGVKCLWFNHGPCSSRWWKGVMHALPADATVVAGRFMEQRHRGLTLAPRPRLISYGLEDHWLEERPELRQQIRADMGLSQGELGVGMLGRIDDWKRQHLFIEAIAKLPPATALRCRFLVGGAPCLGRGLDYWRELQRSLTVHPFSERIQFLGQVQAAAFWEAMDVAVHCTQDEPFGYVILEALAKGKVVIGADSGGVPEMITDGFNGMLQDPTDRQGLADKINTAVTDFEELGLMREAARQTVAQRFNSRLLVDRFEGLYGELLETC